MIEWHPIPENHGGTFRSGVAVMLVALYPGTKIWSDPVYGWMEYDSDSEPELSWARWKHPFPPTHFAFINMPTT